MSTIPRMVLPGKLVERINRVGRLRISRISGMPYSTLTAKINGFCPTVAGDAEKLEAALASLKEGEDEVEQARRRGA